MEILLELWHTHPRGLAPPLSHSAVRRQSHRNQAVAAGTNEKVAALSGIPFSATWWWWKPDGWFVKCVPGRALLRIFRRKDSGRRHGETEPPSLWPGKKSPLKVHLLQAWSPGCCYWEERVWSL